MFRVFCGIRRSFAYAMNYINLSQSLYLIYVSQFNLTAKIIFWVIYTHNIITCFVIYVSHILFAINVILQSLFKFHNEHIRMVFLHFQFIDVNNKFQLVQSGVRSNGRIINPSKWSSFNFCSVRHKWSRLQVFT